MMRQLLKSIFSSALTSHGAIQRHILSSQPVSRSIFSGAIRNPLVLGLNQKNHETIYTPPHYREYRMLVKNFQRKRIKKPRKLIPGYDKDPETMEKTALRREWLKAPDDDLKDDPELALASIKNKQGEKKFDESLIRNHIVRDKVWWLVDCDGQVLGDVAQQISEMLQGKHKLYFKKEANCGDRFVVINAQKIQLAGRKRSYKNYFFHSGYLGNEKYVPFETMLEKHPDYVILKAIKRSLPRNVTRLARLLDVKVFPDEHHPYPDDLLIPLFTASPSARIGYGHPPTEKEFDMLWDVISPFMHPESMDEAIKIVNETRPDETKKEIGLEALLKPAMTDPGTELMIRNYLAKYNSGQKFPVWNIPEQ